MGRQGNGKMKNKDEERSMERYMGRRAGEIGKNGIEKMITGILELGKEMKELREKMEKIKDEKKE